MKGVVRGCVPAALVTAIIAGAVSAANPASNGRILLTDAPSPGFTGPDLFTVNPDGTDRRRLTPDGRIGLPTLSPNGERIAVVKSDGSRPRDLYVMNADGSGGALAIVSHPRASENDDIRALAWSPESDRIAYVYGVAPHIRVVDARDGTPVPLPQSGDPVPQGLRLEWSPDGTELLYEAEDDFWAKPLDGRPARRVVAIPGPDNSPTWSPDGSRIAFIHAATQEAGGVYVVRRDGTDLRHVAATGTAPIGNVRWKPDGTAVVFEARRVEASGGRFPLVTTSILLAGAEGSVVRHLRDHVGQPIPSPDNGQLLVQAFGAVPGGGEGFKPGVYTMNADGTCLTFVTSGTSVDWQRAPPKPLNAPRECVDLVVSATAPGVTGLRGAQYSITVRNDGTLPVSDIRLELRFDVEVRFLFAAVDASRCSSSNVLATCGIGRLSPGQTFQTAILVRPRTAVPLAPKISVASDVRDSDPASNSVSVRTRVYPCWIAGTESNDVLRGTPAGEEICGREGHDTIEGLGGDDRIDGGWGRDTLDGGPGRDRLVGGRADDTILARDGERDVVDCGWGVDTARVDRRDRVLRGCEHVRRR